MKKLLIFFLSIVIIITTIIFINIARDKRSARLDSIGKYKFEYSVSEGKFDRQDSILLEDLFLVLAPDGTFEFSHANPYIDGVSGYWEIDGYGLYQTLDLKMENGRMYQADSCCGSVGEITMGTRLIDGKLIRDVQLGFVKENYIK